jgi:dual specificity protein kinase YAK1
VFRCEDLKTKELVGVKIVKNEAAYFNQALIEARILQRLNTEFDPHGKHGIVRLHDTLTYKKHLCLVFELCSINLYQLIKMNRFRGLNIPLIRAISIQLLDALHVLRRARVLHCDIKPENIVLASLSTSKIKLIDFGSACTEGDDMYSYVQSRFYRAPEVLMGLPYSGSVDIWSVGCVIAELFLGLPLFPGRLHRASFLALPMLLYCTLTLSSCLPRTCACACSR